MTYRERLVDRHTLGVRLHGLRFGARMTLGDVETRIGIPEASLARMEKARARIEDMRGDPMTVHEAQRGPSGHEWAEAWSRSQGT